MNKNIKSIIDQIEALQMAIFISAVITGIISILWAFGIAYNPYFRCVFILGVGMKFAFYASYYIQHRKIKKLEKDTM